MREGMYANVRLKSSTLSTGLKAVPLPIEEAEFWWAAAKTNTGKTNKMKRVLENFINTMKLQRSCPN
jgi:hypothetical protein